jgi:hypothetical protein
MPDQSSDQMVSGRIPRWMIVAGIIVLVLAAIIAAPHIYLGHKLKKHFAAIRAAGYPVTPGELNDWYKTPPTGENAADVLTEAFAKYVEVPDGAPVPVETEVIEPPRTEAYPPEMMQAMSRFIDSNGETLQLLHKASAMAQCRFPTDLSRGPAALLPHLARIRQGARLLAIEVLLRAEERDSARAADAGIAMFGLARTLDHEPLLISRLVRIAVDSMTLERLQRALTRATFTDDQLAALSAAIIASQDEEGMVRAYVGERASLSVAFSNPALVLGTSPAGTTDRITGALYRATGLAKADELLFGEFIARYIDICREPFPRRTELTNTATAEAGKISKTRVASHIMLPAVSAALERDARTVARLRAAQVALAVERYRLAHGTLPESLDKVAPEFLNAVPSDPYDGDPLRYKMRDVSYVVYSVGPNRKDDNGTLPGNGQTLENAGDIVFIVDR